MAETAAQKVLSHTRRGSIQFQVINPFFTVRGDDRCPLWIMGGGGAEPGVDSPLRAIGPIIGAFESQCFGNNVDGFDGNPAIVDDGLDDGFEIVMEA